MTKLSQTSSLTAGSSLFTVSAPSGAGKSSLIAALLKTDPTIRLSISTTTRQPRPGEVDGREYHFTTVETFRKSIEAGEFLEHALVHDNYYGTSKVKVLELLQAGNDVLLEIDWQGALQIREQFPDTVSLFILPPSIAELENRLNKRGQDSQETIKRRIQGAALEISHASDFDYVIINNDFDLALKQLSAVIESARCRTRQQALKNQALFSEFGIISRR
ncbi:MAG: guanylate kinase [Oxalobacter sp.]|nr:guanylate kinase [Oxalobacter sp.]